MKNIWKNDPSCSMRKHQVFLHHVGAVPWRTHLTGWEAVDPHRLSGFFTHKVVQKLLLIVNQLLTSNMQNQ